MAPLQTVRKKRRCRLSSVENTWHNFRDEWLPEKRTTERASLFSSNVLTNNETIPRISIITCTEFANVI